VAPIVGLATMVFADQQLLANRRVLAGSEPLFIRAIPWVTLALFVGGLVTALYWRSRQPERHAAIGRFAAVNVDGDLDAVAPAPAPAA
jgi:lysylphosphatidylglycerol synthetase-like protein (DUF2156 family)